MIPLLPLPRGAAMKNNTAEKLIPALVRTVFGRMIKHTHHDMDVDKLGKR